MLKRLALRVAGDPALIDRHDAGRPLEREHLLSLFPVEFLVSGGIVDRQEIHAAGLKPGPKLPHRRQYADALPEAEPPEVEDDDMPRSSASWRTRRSDQGLTCQSGAG